MLDCCKKNKWFYFGLTIPSMLLYVLALAGPLLLGTLPASFYNWNLIKGNKDFVGLGNYTKLLGDETFIHSVVFTLILAVISILMSNLIGFVIAYFLDSNVRCKGVIRSLFFIPNIISGVMVSFVWSFIFTGAIPNLAKILHIDALANISWFGNAGTAAFTVILVTTRQSTGFLMMLYITGLQTIQKDVLEAAVLDGCTGIKKVIYITAPLCKNMFMVFSVLCITGCLKAFDIVWAMTNGGPMDSSATPAVLLYTQGFQYKLMGRSGSISIILLVLGLILSLLLNNVIFKERD